MMEHKMRVGEKATHAHGGSAKCLVACGVVRDQSIGVLPCVAHGQTKGGAGCAATAADCVVVSCGCSRMVELGYSGTARRSRW